MHSWHFVSFAIFAIGVTAVRSQSRNSQQQNTLTNYGAGGADSASSGYGSPTGNELPGYGDAGSGGFTSTSQTELSTYGNSGSFGSSTNSFLSEDQMNLKMLMSTVPGRPGEDYPIYSDIPDTGFVCENKVFGGYYADQSTQCQVFHVCGRGGGKGWSFLCPNGTIFNQQYLICDWWFNVDCSVAEALYSVNDQLGVVPQGSRSNTNGGNANFGTNNNFGSTSNNLATYGSNDNQGSFSVSQPSVQQENQQLASYGNSNQQQQQQQQQQSTNTGYQSPTFQNNQQSTEDNVFLNQVTSSSVDTYGAPSQQRLRRRIEPQQQQQQQQQPEPIRPQQQRQITYQLQQQPEPIRPAAATDHLSAPTTTINFPSSTKASPNPTSY